MKRLTLVTTILAAALLSGCASKENIVPDVPASQLYSSSQQSLHSGNWQLAIERLETLDSRYPFGAYSEQVQLDLIYAYYKNANLPMAMASIDRFLRVYPGAPKTDWVLYMRGLTNMGEGGSFLNNALGVSKAARDTSTSQQAFEDFQLLLSRFPNSPYNADAQKRMVYLKNLLANHDLDIAKFYLKRGAWIATVNRCQQIQRLYSNTKAAKESLPIMLQAYEKLKLATPIANTKALMKANNIQPE